MAKKKTANAASRAAEWHGKTTGNSEAPSGCVKASTLFVVAGVTLTLGFFLGAMFMAEFSGDVPAGAHDPAPQAQSAPANEIAILESQAAANPGSFEHWTKLGHAYFDSRQPAKAIEAYQKALAIRPDAPDVIVDMGVMYRRNGRPQMALESFERALALKPDHEIARFNKGIVLVHDLDRPAEGVVAWERILRDNPRATAPNGQPLAELIEAHRPGPLLPGQ